MNAGWRLRVVGRDGQPPWRREREGSLGLSVISVSLSFSWQCHLLGAAGQRGWGQPEPWTGGLRVLGFCFFVNPGGGLGSRSHPT